MICPTASSEKLAMAETLAAATSRERSGSSCEHMSSACAVCDIAQPHQRCVDSVVDAAHAMRHHHRPSVHHGVEPEPAAVVDGFRAAVDDEAVGRAESCARHEAFEPGAQPAEAEGPRD